MKAFITQIQCITNMHVGSGDVNYNIIDKEIERDPVTNYPTINASGVKGALREYFRIKNVQGLNEMFGAEIGTKTKQGKVKVLGADMIAIPCRASDGEKPYYLVTTEYAVTRVNELSDYFIHKDLFEKKEAVQGIIEIEGHKPIGKRRIGEKDIYIMKNEDFESIDLPVIARNKLENGISKNLWYEEVVPHDSMFLFPIVSEDEAILEQFKEVINDEIIQFGANASIGYGLCKVTILE